MLDFAVVNKEIYKRALSTVMALKGPRVKAIEAVSQDADLLKAVCALDPTPGLKYIKWILTRLYRNPQSIAESLRYQNEDPGRLRELLLEFEAAKHLLPIHMRDIFNYRTLESLEEVLRLQRKDRGFKALRLMVNGARAETIYHDTLLHEHDGFSVHQPRSVEDVIVLTGSQDVFDLRGNKLYRDLALTGKVYVFNTNYGVFVGAIPENSGEKGVLVDFTGEMAIFEDALQAHRDVTWESCSEIYTLLCQIDPALPFDEELEAIGPYRVALNQFPLILDEDREVPDYLVDELLQDPQLNEEARKAIQEAR